MAYTKGKWKVGSFSDKPFARSLLSVYREDGEVIIMALTPHFMPFEEAEANAHLIAAAVNACASVNPDNPQAVAESIEEMYEALKKLPSRKSLLEDAAYTGGDVPKKWINDRGHFNDGYNQALKDVAQLREQALAKAASKPK